VLIYGWHVAIARSKFALYLASSAFFPTVWRAKALRLLGLRVGRNCVLFSGFFLPYANLEVGNDVFINFGLRVLGQGKVTLDDEVSIGPDVAFYTDTHPIESGIRRASSVVTVEGVHVGRGSWLGARVTLLPGCNIAAGCVVAAGSVVTRATAPHGLYAGIPARRIRDLDPLEGHARSEPRTSP
jgi:maltose O-acetyltransferase